MPKEPPSQTLLRLAQNVRSLREEKNITQEQLSAKASLSATFVQQLEHDARNISIRSAEKIAHVLGVELKDLL